MDQNFWITFTASAIAGIVATGGILSIRRFEAWARHNTTYFTCFAAGVLIAVSFLHIVPKSFSMNVQAPAYLFAGYLLMHVFNRFLTAYVCDKPQTADYALGLVPLFGIGFHSFLDGVVYSISFSVSLFTGVLVALGMVLHEFPEGIVTYTLLVRSGFTERRSFALAFFAAAVTTPLGTLASYPFVSHIDQPLLGSLLALSAGALIYVGATLHLADLARAEAAVARIEASFGRTRKDYVLRHNRASLLDTGACAGGWPRHGARWPREMAPLAARDGRRCRWQLQR